jgi:hypothetical protein
MREMLGAVMIAGAAWSASAAESSPYDVVMAPYIAELSRQCPDKHLELLAPAALRDALDDYKSSLLRRQEKQMDLAEGADCADSMAGTSCPNVADIRVANRLNLTRNLAAKICGAFKLCRKQSDCD